MASVRWLIHQYRLGGDASFDSPLGFGRNRILSQSATRPRKKTTMNSLRSSRKSSRPTSENSVDSPGDASLHGAPAVFGTDS